MDLKITVIGADMSSESADVSILIINDWKYVPLCKERGCPNGGDKKFGYCKWH